MPAIFKNKLFPKDISYGSVFIPGYSTRIGEALSGFENRNPNWENSRMKLDVRYGVREQKQLDDLLYFHHEMMGAAYSFLVFDHTDYRSLKSSDPNQETFQDQIILDSAIGGETIIQTVKKYGTIDPTSRDIFRLDSNFTYLLGINGVEKFSPADFTVNNDTGQVTLVSPLLPGDQVTAGYRFFVTMRFKDDEIPISLEFYQGGGSSVMLIEDRVEI